MLQWFGTITSVTGSFIVALGFALIGYCAFILGAVSWLVVGIKGKNRPLITLNAFFLAANLIGLYRAIF
jgi:hypothetical protein